MFLKEYGLRPEHVDEDLTGNDVYMILYQRAANAVNSAYESMKKGKGKGAPGQGMSREQFINKFAG